MYPYAALLSVRNATQVAVEGGGIIRGQGAQWLRRAPRLSAYWAARVRAHPLVDVFGSVNVMLRDVTIEDSTAVSLAIRHSRQVVADHLLVRNYVEEEEHIGVLVENSDTVEVTRSEIWSGGSFGLGVRAGGGGRVHDIVAQRCVLRNGSGVGVMRSPAEGAAGSVSEVVFRDLLLDGRSTPSWNRTYFGQSGGLVVHMREFGDTGQGGARLAVERVLFQDVVALNLSRGIDLAVPEPDPAGELGGAPRNRANAVEFRNATFDGSWEAAVRVQLPDGNEMHRVSMQDLAFTHNSKYGWDCAGALYGRAENVVPDIPLRCSVHPEALEEEAFAD